MSATSDETAQQETTQQETAQQETAQWLRLQRRAHREFSARIAAVRDWSGATPDTEWTIADLVRHVIQEQQWVPWLLSGLSTTQARTRLDALDSDLVHEWQRYSLAATTAWRDAPPRSTVALASDTVEVIEYLKEQVADVTIHAWDLARATGSDESLDEELVAAVWTIFEPQRATLQASGLYASPVPIDDDAPLQSRLLALTGRDDRVTA